jgi:3-hydroxyisobutyrate dehydrogenase
MTAVGVIGLGSMGGGVAKSLLAKKFETHVYDVRPETVKALVAQGAKAAATPAALGAACGVVVVLVVNAEQTEKVLFGEQGAASAMKAGAVVVSSATLAPDVAEQLGARLERMGLLMIDAPVSGGAAKAAAGEMTIMASGAPEAFARCEKVLDAIAARVYRLGDRPGPGSKVKLINQLLAGVHIVAACEAMALGMRAGADPKTLYEVISNSAGSSWMFQNRVPHILAGDYTPLSAVNIFVKDLGIVLDTAKKLAFPLPLTAAAHQLYLAAAAQGHGLEDDASVVKVYAALAGLELPTK